jgi:hypothetical protein
LGVDGLPRKKEVLPAFSVDDPKLASRGGGGSRRLIEILMLANCKELRIIPPVAMVVVWIFGNQTKNINPTLVLSIEVMVTTTQQTPHDLAF